MKQTSIQKAVEIVGSQSAFARALGVTPGRVWQWLNGWPVSTRYFVAIENATNGQVTRTDLLNDEVNRKQKPNAA